MSVRVLIVSWLRQGIVIGQAWLTNQVYIGLHDRTTAFGEIDATEYGQCYIIYILLSSIDRVWIGSAADYPYRVGGPVKVGIRIPHLHKHQ